MAGWRSECSVDKYMYCMIMVSEGEWSEHGVLWRAYFWLCDYCKNDVWAWGRVRVQAFYFFFIRPTCTETGFSKPQHSLPNPKLLPFTCSSFICHWRAWVPLSTSASCCLWCRPLEEVLWMAGCGCHSLLGRRGRWTRCDGQCGFRRHRPLWFCGKPGCQNSCSWCSSSASCARPGIRRCRVTQWPLWQG